MIEHNISFVPKAPEEFLSEAEKIKYIQSALHQVSINEASAMDALDIFEKYGSRYEYNIGNCGNAIIDLSVAATAVAKKLDSKTVDKFLSRYVDLFNKFADITPPRHNDTRYLGGIIRDHHNKMSEETVNKCIEALKKFSFERSQTWTVRKYILENEFTKRTPEELSRIEAKVKELEEVVKDMPSKDRTRHNG